MASLIQRSGIPGFLARAVGFSLVWFVLAEGDPTSWWFGAPIVLAAAWWARGARAPGVRAWSPLGTLAFALYFVRESVRSGFDVAWRAFRPRMGLHPAFVKYPVRLQPGVARYLFVHAITLMPGTLSAHLAGDELVVHVLDEHAPYREDLARLEERAAGVFGRAPLIREGRGAH